MDAVCDRAGMQGAPRFTEFCEALLDLTFAERKVFAQKLVELALNERNGWKAEFLVKGTLLAVKVVARNLSETDLKAEAAALQKLNRTRGLAISLTAQPDWHVHAWVVVG